MFTDSACSISAGATGLSGNVITTGAGGLATFVAFKSTLAGVYYVKASGASISSSCSGAASKSLTVTSGAAATISFSIQPAGTVTAGTAFTTQPSVLVVDAFGNPVNAQSVTLTPFVSSDCLSAGSGALSNGVLSTGSSGVSAFSTLSYNLAESIYLKATTGKRGGN
jgi:hypothetical protein